MSMITKLRLVLAGLAACLAMLTGESNAAEKITLTCAGTMTSSRSWEQQIDGPESVVIDLDRSVVIWGHDTYPIVRTAGNTIGFESASGEKIEGSIDRVSGALSATWKYDSGGPHTITFDLNCRPPATQKD